MSRNPLDTIMAPGSVGFLGASNTLGKMETSELLKILCNDRPGAILPSRGWKQRETDLNAIVIVDGRQVVVDALFV